MQLCIVYNRSISFGRRCELFGRRCESYTSVNLLLRYALPLLAPFLTRSHATFYFLTGKGLVAEFAE
jgi:hypothetical protein